MKYLVMTPPVDFSVPFRKLAPQQIHIYFHYTNEIGYNTCKRNCDNCYFKNKPMFHIPIEKALAISHSLSTQGYKIGITPADSFSEEALRAGDAGSAFQFNIIGNSAWTSGIPLSLLGWEKRLDRAWEIGFRSIVISAHEVAGTFVPFSGITPASFITRAIHNIQRWNENNKSNRRFQISTTFTIRKDNCDLEPMREMIIWGIKEKIDLVRFNCFTNHLLIPKHEQYEISKKDIIKFFGFMKNIHEEFYTTPIQLGISEDWGNAGIEQIYPYLPPEWQNKKLGVCCAGYRLFAVVEIEKEIVVVGCVDRWEPILGKVIQTGTSDYIIDWDYDQIEELRQMILQKKLYACWGGVGYKRKEEAGFEVNSKDELLMFSNKNKRLGHYEDWPVDRH